MQRNSKIFLYLMAGCMLLIAALSPFNASAATTSAVIPTSPPIVSKPYNAPDGRGLVHICPGTDSANPEKGLTTRLIPCIRNTVIYATSEMVTPLSKFFAGTMAVLFTLAIIFWGFMVASGNVTAISQNGIILAVKIGAVIYFTSSFGTYYPKLLESLENILTLVAKPAVSGSFIWRDASSSSATFCSIATYRAGEQAIMTIWNILDCYIDLFLGGIFSPLTITTGIMGFIVGAAYSTDAGVFIAMAGIYVLATGLFTIARVVYIFVTSYIAFSFMIIISSIFLPCILFKSTKRYFDNWLQLTINFFIQPLFLMGYLIMFLVAFNTTIFHGTHSLYYAIAGQDSQQNGFQLGEWINNNGGYKETTVSQKGININPAGAAKETGVNGNLQPVPTGIAGTQGARPANNGMIAALGFVGSNVNFFQAGVKILAIDWEPLARKARATEFGNLPSGDKDALEKFYKNYKLTIFMAFLMAAVFMYLFFSLLAYIPYIGNAAAGGGTTTLGGGITSIPGTRLFSHAEK